MGQRELRQKGDDVSKYGALSNVEVRVVDDGLTVASSGMGIAGRTILGGDGAYDDPPEGVPALMFAITSTDFYKSAASGPAGPDAARALHRAPNTLRLTLVESDRKRDGTVPTLIEVLEALHAGGDQVPGDQPYWPRHGHFLADDPRITVRFQSQIAPQAIARLLAAVDVVMPSDGAL